MKLVDSDEVVRIVREEVKDEDNTLPVSFRAGVDYVLKIISELSAVDVIPAEWIKNWISEHGIFRADANAMLKAWEKENETN